MEAVVEVVVAVTVVVIVGVVAVHSYCYSDDPSFLCRSVCCCIKHSSSCETQAF